MRIQLGTRVQIPPCPLNLNRNTSNGLSEQRQVQERTEKKESKT